MEGGGGEDREWVCLVLVLTRVRKETLFGLFSINNVLQLLFFVHEVLTWIYQGTQWDVHVKLSQDGPEARRYLTENNGFGVQPTRGDGSLYFEVTRL